MVFNIYTKDILIQFSRCGGFGSGFGKCSDSHYLLFLIKTRLFLGPGTAPLTPIMELSLSIIAIFKCFVVTFSWPICPAIFFPGKILCGYIEPIEPGLR